MIKNLLYKGQKSEVFMDKSKQKRFREVLGILSKEELTKDDIRILKHNVNPRSCLPAYLKEVILRITNNSEYEINLSQTVFAKEYLKEKIFKRNGSLRTNLGAFGGREIEIISDLKTFKFVGFKPLTNRAGQYTGYYEILYKAIDKKNNSFTYTGVTFDAIEILN